MNQEVDYASDSDQSDEDFRPDKETGVSDSDAESVEDSADSVDDDSSASEENNETVKRRQKKKISKASTKSKTIKKSTGSTEGQTISKRTTRQTEDTNGNGKISTEKNELESDDDEKSRTDALWADFMSDVKPASSKKIKTSIPTKITNSDSAISAKTSPKKDETSKVTEKHVQEIIKTASPKQIVVTEIVDFAGEEVRIQKIVNADSIKENKSAQSLSKSSPNLSGLNSRNPVAELGGSTKRIAASAGLGSILNQIGKKKKISMLEKTKHDWNNFKQDEGIDEELQTFNKGKDGYLERQDFLQRTDLRQFEIEKGLRQSKRNN